MTERHHTVSIGITAEGRDLTLGELRLFVQDAIKARVPDDALVRPRLSWSGRLTGLLVDERSTDAKS